MNPHQHHYHKQIQTLKHTIQQLEGHIKILTAGKPQRYIEDIEEKAKATKILTEMQKWRRSQPPYEGSNTMPYTPKQYGEAIDTAIAAINTIQPRI